MTFDVGPVVGISIIVVPFLALLVWALRHNRNREARIERWFAGLCGQSGATREPRGLRAHLSHHGVDFEISYTVGGEEPDRLNVSTSVAAIPDHLTVNFDTWLTRLLSTKPHTGDGRFNARVSFQIAKTQNHPESRTFAHQLFSNPPARQALLAIADTGFGGFSVPGSYKSGSFSEKVEATFVPPGKRMHVSAENPRAAHFDAGKAQTIMENMVILKPIVEGLQETLFSNDPAS